MRNALWCFLSSCKPLSGKRLQSLAVTVSESNLALCVELGLIYCSVLSHKQNQNSRIDMQSNMWLHFLPFHHQEAGNNCFKGYLVSSVGELYLKWEPDRLLFSFIHKPETAYWGCEKWGKLSYCLHLWRRDLGFGSSITMFSRQGWQSPEVILLSKRVGWAKGTGLWLFLCLHSESRGYLDVGQTGALLVQSEENKERWKMEGWKEEEQRREGGEARTEGGSLFSSDTGVMFLGINTGSLYQCKEHLER